MDCALVLELVVSFLLRLTMEQAIDLINYLGLVTSFLMDIITIQMVIIIF